MSTSFSNASLLVTYTEAARMLGVCPATVSQLLRDGRLQGVSISPSRLRITRASVMALVTPPASLDVVSVKSFADVIALARAFRLSNRPDIRGRKGKSVMMAHADVIALADLLANLDEHIDFFAPGADRFPRKSRRVAQVGEW